MEPTRRNPKQRRSIRTRERLLDAARAEFGMRGYATTQSGDIARGAGVSVGTFYEYFRDKRAAFLVVLHAMLGTILEIDLALSFEKEPSSTRWYRLIDMFRAFRSPIAAFGRLYADICATAPQDEVIATELREFEKTMVSRLTAIIGDGIPYDSEDRIEAGGELIWSIIHSTLLRAPDHDALLAEAAFAIDRYLVEIGR